jgi:hypothetical protein
MGFDARTPVPTVTGWKPAALIESGDTVFSYDGLPTKVVSTQEFTPRACYKLWMRDDLTLVVDGRTGIPALTYKQTEILRKWTRKKSRHQELEAQPMSPEMLMEQEKLVRIINCRPLMMPERELPVDPYILGQWICERSRNRQNKQTHITRQLIEKYPTLPRTIPEEYFFGSFEQRLALARGIFSKRGTFRAKDAMFFFDSRDYGILRQVQNLVESLGVATKITQHGRQNKFHIEFKTFLKLVDGQTSTGKEFYYEFRTIKRMEEVKPRPCIYIKTENPNNTVVVSEGYLPICL